MNEPPSPTPSETALLESVPDSIIISDLEGRVTYWNQGATALWGYEADEMLGESVARLYPEMDPEQTARDLEGIQAGRDVVGEWLGRHKDGGPVWVQITTSLLRDHDGRPVGFIGVAKDITERKLAEVRDHVEAKRELEQEASARFAAERSAELRQRLLSMVAHDLRNPLSAIVTSAGLIEAVLRGTGMEPRLERALGAIRRSTAQMSRLVRDLLDTSRAEVGTLDVDVATHEATQILREAAEAFAPQAARRRIHLEVTVEAPRLIVRCDRDRATQVLWNLLGNALRFTPDVGAVRILVEREGEMACFRVSDTGPGVPRELSEDIFEPYRQAEPSRHGAGLGLYIARRLAEAQGGSLHLADKGPGATFLFRLPLAEPA